MPAYISAELRMRVAQRANYRCGYCQTQSAIIGDPLEIDHIIPEKKGGRTEIDNLCLACSRCNKCKGSKTEAVDPATNNTVSLFNPLSDNWSDHFAWSDDGLDIVGKTATGRATIVALRMNAMIIRFARKRWVSAGWHPTE